MSRLNVVFDFYGTLAEAAEAGPSFDDVLTGMGYPRQGTQAWELLATEAAEHAAHSVSRETYMAWEHSRLARFAFSAGVPGDRVDDVVAALYEASKGYRLDLYEETVEVLEALTAGGARLAVCSNWDWDLPEHLGDLGIDGFFDATVVSARAGARKPHPLIYSRLTEAVACEPGEVLFVGDTWDADVEGPIATGMRAVHVCRSHDTRDRPELPSGASRVSDLRGVLDLL